MMGQRREEWEGWPGEKKEEVETSCPPAEKRTFSITGWLFATFHCTFII